MPFEQAPSVPPEIESGDEQSKRRRRRAAAFIASALLATGLASVAATAHEGNASGFFQAAGEALIHPGSHTTGSIDQHTVSIGQAEYPAAASVGLENTQYSTDTVTETVITPHAASINKEGPMPWALEFGGDPEATNTERTAAVIESIAAQIKAKEVQGAEINRITVEGFASDEDDAANGGLEKANPKNVELADIRAQAAKKLLVDMLHREHIGHPVEILPGKEVISRELDKKIEQLAHEKGISTLELVQQYNRHEGSLTESDLRVLDGLASDRFVRVTVTMTEQVPTTVTKNVLITKQTGGKIIIVPFIVPVFGKPEEPIAIVEAAPAMEPLPPPRPKPEIVRDLPHHGRQVFHASAIHRKMPRPHNFHGGRLSTKGKNNGGRQGRASGGHKH